MGKTRAGLRGQAKPCWVWSLGLTIALFSQRLATLARARSVDGLGLCVRGGPLLTYRGSDTEGSRGPGAAATTPTKQSQEKAFTENKEFAIFDLLNIRDNNNIALRISVALDYLQSRLDILILGT